jgi:hypothetical protein
LPSGLNASARTRSIGGLDASVGSITTCSFHVGRARPCARAVGADREARAADRDDRLLVARHDAGLGAALGAERVELPSSPPRSTSEPSAENAPART